MDKDAMQMYANSQYNLSEFLARCQVHIKIRLKNMTLKASFVDLRTTNQHGCGVDTQRHKHDWNWQEQQVEGMMVTMTRVAV